MKQGIIWLLREQVIQMRTTHTLSCGNMIYSDNTTNYLEGIEGVSQYIAAIRRKQTIILRLQYDIFVQDIV